MLAPLAVQAADGYSLSIERQPLARVLRELSEQTGLQIVAMFTTDQGDASKPVGPLRGEFTAEAALQKLLADSDLTFTRVNSNTISITSKAPSSSAKRTVQAPTKKFSPLSFVATAPAHQTDVESVLVTGSHIRGARAAGSKLLMIGRAAIESSGQGRLPDALTTLSQNFHGVSEAYTQPTGVYNFNRGAEIQLRGLGPGTTLTLVDGQRQASGGQRGSMVDISSIATSAIERVEILPEGASALYGSDAIGGVINVILRKDFNGFETSVRGASAGGEADETQFAQLWGKTWDRGNVLIGYQYNERDPLRASARSYGAANDDLRAFGGSDFRVLGSNPGTILNAQLQPIAAIPAGQDGTNLTSAALLPGAVNYADLSSRYWVLPEQKQHSAFMHGSFDLTDRWQAFVDGRYSSRGFELHSANSRRNVTVPASNAFNRIGGTVRVAYDFADDLGVYTLSGRTETVASSAGVTGELGNDWQIKLTGGYAKERNASHTANGINSTALTQFLASNDPAVALNVFGDGSHTNPATLAALRASTFEQSEWTTTSANVLVDGPLFDGPGGWVRGALGADFRREHLTHVNPAFSIARNVGRDVSAVFTELAVPLLGPRDARSSEAELELSLAGRYEDYQDVGSTFDPKFGLGWRPLRAVKFRGTWGTSFRAPPFHLADGQFQTSFAQVRSVVDPQSQAANGMSQVLVLGGAREDIKEETADVWTAGVDFTVPFLDDLSIALTYFDISYDDKIQYPGAHTTYLTQAVQYAPLITRNPTAEQVQALCNSSPVSPGNCNQPIAAILDTRIRNLSNVQTRGVDADIAYEFDTAIGEMGLGLRGTYTLDYVTQLTDTAAAHDVVDTLNNPLALRLAGTVSWARNDWKAYVTLNYAGRYQISSTSQLGSIGSWTTVDVNVSYQVTSDNAWLSDTRIYLGAINLFDREPPFVNVAGVFAYDGANATLLGRQLNLQIIKHW